MTKNQILALTIGAVSMGLTSCDGTGGIKKTSDGLMYKIAKDEKGEKHPQVNDIVKMHVHIRIGDSVVLDSRMQNNNMPFELPLPEPTFKSDWIAGISLLTAGDSAIFYIPVDTAKKYAEKQGGIFPPFAKSTDTVVYTIKLVSFESSAEMQKKEAEAAKKQQESDDLKLKAYFAEKGLSPQKTESGLYYIIDKPGTGANIQQGQLISVNYTGTRLDGVAFDSNLDPKFQHTEPLKFTAGGREVIRGWDEGVLLLNKGSKARFFIPSTLAYGPREMSADLPANSILIFDVEVLNVEDAPAAPVQ